MSIESDQHFLGTQIYIVSVSSGPLLLFWGSFFLSFVKENNVKQQEQVIYLLRSTTFEFLLSPLPSFSVPTYLA